MSKKHKKGKRREKGELPRERSNGRHNENGGGGFWASLREETRNSIVGIVFLILSLVMILAAWGDGGYLGEHLYGGIHFLFGIGYYLVPALFFLLAINFFRAGRHGVTGAALVAGPFFLLSALGLLGLLDADAGKAGVGGWVGYAVMGPMVFLFAPLITGIVLSAVFLISILILFDVPLHLGFALSLWRMITGKKAPEDADDDDMRITGDVDDEDADEDAHVEGEANVVGDGESEAENDEVDADDSDEEDTDQEIEPKIANADAVTDSRARTGRGGAASGGSHAPFRFNSALHMEYVAPPLSLLAADRGKAGYGDIKANANIIKRTLANFGIQVEMDEVSVGPSFTRYALKPAEGVRLAKITTLQHDLELALAAAPIRIEAPIPGKSLVGIEIPNSQKSLVGLGTLLADPAWSENPNPLFVPLGKGISGAVQLMNIAKMPHLLVAGATGSGKSVSMHTIITSLLYRNSPEQLRLIMVDPKRVELTLYNGIPHLLTPVITEAKKTILTLKWATKEMERRYEVLQAEKCRDIQSYHKTVLEPALAKFEKEKEEGRYAEGEEPELPELMPYILVIIDELADIMQAYPRELESAIVRLAQMSRAVGIHLMIATQRPSVNVITGLIKANIPARIALQVASQIDSRTIIDMSGAENLLGSGDMLFISAEMPKPVRLQSAFISEGEVKNVVKFLKDHYEGTLGDELNISGGDPNNKEGAPFGGIPEEALMEGEEGNDDDMYEAAKDLVVKSQKASTSFLQRRLGLGYARAARIMDILEERGVVGPADGAKPRDVLMRPDDVGGFGHEPDEEK